MRLEYRKQITTLNIYNALGRQEADHYPKHLQCAWNAGSRSLSIWLIISKYQEVDSLSRLSSRFASKCLNILKSVVKFGLSPVPEYSHTVWIHVQGTLHDFGQFCTRDSVRIVQGDYLHNRPNNLTGRWQF